MPFRLDNIVPWGRSFDEYRAMFRLTRADLEGHILGCADGPASFCAELSSHFLFLYSEQLDRETHLASLLEMLRVALEVRVFPLLELGSIPSRHLEPLLDELQHSDLVASVEAADYELQRGGSRMLRVRESYRPRRRWRWL